MRLHAFAKRSHSALRLSHGQASQKVVFREADDVFCVHVEFQTSYGRFIDVAGQGGKSERRQTRQKVLNCSNFSLRTTTCNKRETHVIIRFPTVIKSWGDAVRLESFVVCHGRARSSDAYYTSVSREIACV